MPYELFESLIQQISHPRKLLLNYSGESTVYPQLIPAIRRAASTGAFVELVTALVNMGDAALAELCVSGVDRLTVSVHSTDPDKYREIYRYGSFEALENKLRRLVKLCRAVPNGPIVDLAFVAMDRNVDDLWGVTRLAQSLDLPNISVFPVMRRDEIPVQFPSELAGTDVYHAAFTARVAAAMDRAKNEAPETSISVCNPAFAGGDRQLGTVPRPCSGVLPPDAQIHSCEQNPWETAHVLSNGDVVACERLDKIPLGNLQRLPLLEIWHGDAYRDFRERYRRGEVPECRTCPWKWAYRPGPLQSDIVAARGLSPQLLHGWHTPSGEAFIWSSQQAAAVIAPRENSRVLHVSGTLPPGFDGHPNELVILCNGAEVGGVTNPWAELMPFGLDFAVQQNVGQDEPASEWFVEFRTRYCYRPSRRGTGPDQRDLGFALFLLASKTFVDPEHVDSRQEALQPLHRAIDRIDQVGRVAGHWFGRRHVRNPARLVPGLSVLIPECDNIAELSACLASLKEAAARWREPIQTIILVNGSEIKNYGELRARYSEFHWRFEKRALGFSGAVVKGLSDVVFDWVYLLNSDVVLDRDALVEVGQLRDSRIFSVASQILLKDRTRFRDETNWTTLFLENGLATIHDRIPQSSEAIDGFYAGGGASLFQTRMLRRFAKVSAYHPFYWEDVEWGWRARKMGYSSVFCPSSIAHHTQRSTIDRRYHAAEVDRVFDRNRFLFQLRNFTSVGSLSRVIEELTLTPHDLDGHFTKYSTLWQIACGRIWNHLAPISDDEVLTTWHKPILHS